MNWSTFLALPFIFFSIGSWAQGCPPGQYQIGGQGAVACAPISQGGSRAAPAARPLGEWIKTWGSVAIGHRELERNLGATTGKLSKADAESDALARCAKNGETDCQIGLTYLNQCIAVGEPQIDGKPNLTGNVQFFGAGTIEEAATAAQAACERRNPENQCKVIYKACTEPLFKHF